MQAGGATGFAMVMLAHTLVEAGIARHVLVVAGENRLTGQGRQSAIETLAQVGHPQYEVPLGPTIPAYYGLVASRYMHEHGIAEAELAELAVLMRRHAAMHPGAQFKEPITVADVLASRPIATPLKLLDCCPVSDGGAAFVVSRERTEGAGIRVRGCGQAHTHQHVSAAASLTEFGARTAMERARATAKVAVADVRYAAVYDSFTMTLAILLEELGLCAARGGGRAGARRIFQLRRRLARQHPRRALVLRPLRGGWRHRASRRDGAADDRPRRPAPGEGRLPGTPAWRRRRHVVPRQPGPGARAMSAVSGGGLADWTQGTRGIAYQRCSGCGRVWYFRRSFCPRCGAERVEEHHASGRGVVHAATMVHGRP